MGARRFSGYVVAAMTVAFVGVFGVMPGPAGAAGTPFTWLGGSSTSQLWSDAGNWSGGTAPSSNASNLDLTFPDLGSCTSPDACYEGTNDRTGLGLDSVDFTGTAFDSYQLGGNQVSVGSGGISSSSIAALSMPLQLTATQTWSVGGGDVTLAGPVTGSSPLTVDLSDTPSPFDNTGTLAVTGDTEVGPVTFTTPSNTPLGLIELTAVSSNSASLNGTNGHAVSLTNGTNSQTHLIVGGPGTNEIGALSLGSGSFLNLGAPGGSLPAAGPADLHVNGGVTFSPSSGFADTFHSVGTTAGTDFGELTATGDVTLTGASFGATDDAVGSCPTDSEIGTSFPLIQTPGTISGVFTGAGGDELVALNFGNSCAAMMQMHYTPHEVYGTIVSTTGQSSSMVVSATPPTTVAGQSVTLTATLSGSSGTPTGSVVFEGPSVGTVCIATVAAGTASCSSAAAPVGQDGITAIYSGDSTYSFRTSGVVLTVTNPPPPPPPPAAPHGYWLVGSDGGIFTFGSSQFYGSTGNLRLQRPVVGISPTSDRAGYWMVASDGGVFAYGDAGFVGSIPGVGLHPAGSGLPHSLNAPIVGMVPSHDGGGYFMVASDGGVFAFGDAQFAGSCPGIGGCSGTAVAVMPDASGNGYWIVTNSGNVYGFGDAAFYGSPGHGTASSAVATPDGRGYWVLLSDGEVFAYGSAANLGSPSPGGFNAFDPANAIFATSDGGGYWVSSAAGAVYTFGDAPNDGSMAGSHLNGAIIAGNGY
jgi:hypothetical protein